MKQKSSKSTTPISKSLPEPEVKAKRGRPRKVVLVDAPVSEGKPKNYYVDPDVFKADIVLAYKKKEITDPVAATIFKIATRLAFNPKFINYTYKEEMIGDAIIKMLMAVKNKKYRPDAGNAFSYFNMIAFHSFQNRIKKEKREKDFIYSMQDETLSELENGGYYNRKGTTSEYD